MATIISTSFTAVGTSNALDVKLGGLVAYNVSGTFVGTVLIERSVHAGVSWATAATLTAPGSGILVSSNPNSGPEQYRIRCSAFSSGTIVTTLQDFDASKMSNQLLRSAAATVTTATPLNITATPLTIYQPGFYDFFACVGFLPAASTSITTLDVAISNTSATLPGTDTIGVQDVSGQIRMKDSRAAYVPGANDQTIDISVMSAYVPTQTSFYLVAQAAFSVAGLTAYGEIIAVKRG